MIHATECNAIIGSPGTIILYINYKVLIIQHYLPSLGTSKMTGISHSTVVSV